MQQGGAYLNDVPVKDDKAVIGAADFSNAGSALLRAGKKKIHRLMIG